MNSKLFVLITLSVLMFGISESFASNEIIFDVDKNSYSSGDIVELKGQVKDSPSQLVAIEVKDIDGNTILIRTVQTDDQGNFVLKFKVPMTAKTGKLDIVANTEINGMAVTESKQSELVQTSQCPDGQEWIESSGVCMTPEPTSSVTTKPESKGGGCLIATATYGSELAPQVQQLRELRDNQLLQTQSGTSFMSTFNQFYYSFSPTIADWERESPVFKEAVKLTLTPMISSLSILNHVDMDSEESVLGYGISLILLNVGMYFVAPAVVIHTIRKKL